MNMQGMPITIIGNEDTDDIEVRTASGHAFSLPRTAVPEERGADGTFPFDLERAASTSMPDDVRNRMSRALLNELMTSSTETI